MSERIDQREIAELVRRTRAEQGLPARVEDESTLFRIAALIRVNPDTHPEALEGEVLRLESRKTDRQW